MPPIMGQSWSVYSFHLSVLSLRKGLPVREFFLCCFVGLLCYSFTPMILLFSAPFEIIFSFSVFVIMTDIL